jgi:hypothetical protein
MPGLVADKVKRFKLYGRQRAYLYAENGRQQTRAEVSTIQNDELGDLM